MIITMIIIVMSTMEICNTDNIKIQEYQNSITRSIFDIPLLDCVCVFFALINFFLSFCFMNF